jgi:hypothetical protein
VGNHFEFLNRIKMVVELVQKSRWRNNSIGNNIKISVMIFKMRP